MVKQKKHLKHNYMQLGNAATRGGIKSEVTEYQTDLQGNIAGFSGFIEVQNEQGGVVKERVSWDLAGRHITNSPQLLDLVFNHPIAEEEEPTIKEGETPIEKGGKSPTVDGIDTNIVHQTGNEHPIGVKKFS